MKPKTTNEHPANRPRCFRRQYIINRRFQLKYTGLAAFCVFAVSLVASIAIYFIQFQESQARILSSAWTHAQENTFAIGLFGVIFAGAMAVGFGLWSIMVTHRICGPIFVIRRFLDDLMAGSFPTRRALRAKDDFNDFYDHFWRTIDALRTKKHEETAQLSDALYLAASAAAKTDSDAGKSDLRALITILDTLCAEGSKALRIERDDTPHKDPRPAPEFAKECAAVPT